jgi:hypothetical protein
MECFFYYTHTKLIRNNVCGTHKFSYKKFEDFNENK